MTMVWEGDGAMYFGSAIVVITWSTMMWFVVVKDFVLSKRELYKEEHEKFLYNIEKFQFDEDVVMSQLSQANTFKKLKKKNRDMERAIKKHNL